MIVSKQKVTLQGAEKNDKYSFFFFFFFKEKTSNLFPSTDCSWSHWFQVILLSFVCTTTMNHEVVFWLWLLKLKKCI